MYCEIKFLASGDRPNDLPASEIGMAVFTSKEASPHVFQRSCSQMMHYALCFCFSLGFEKWNFPLVVNS